MKKIISLMLVAVLMMGTLASCGDKSNNTVSKPLSEIVADVVEKTGDSVKAEQKEIDLSDESEEGKWLIESTLGMKDVSQLKEAVVYEPAINAVAFSMVLVRVNDPADAKEVANTMKANIDPRKWVCVSADDVQTAICKDVVMFVMLDSNLGVKTDDYVTAFQEICGK